VPDGEPGQRFLFCAKAAQSEPVSFGTSR